MIGKKCSNFFTNSPKLFIFFNLNRSVFKKPAKPEGTIFRGFTKTSRLGYLQRKSHMSHTNTQKDSGPRQDAITRQRECVVKQAVLQTLRLSAF
jgi:hypothetical protein